MRMASTPANELDEMEEVDTDGVVGRRRDRVEFRRDRVRIPTLSDSSAVASDFRRGHVRFPTRSRPNSGVVTSGSLMESRRGLAAGLRPGGWLATERVANGDEARRSTVTRRREARNEEIEEKRKRKFYSHRLLNKLPRFKEEMETVMRKVQQKYKKLREEMGRWDELQSGLLSHFHSASSIIDRLRVSFFSVLHIVKNFIVCMAEKALSRYFHHIQQLLLSDMNNYGALRGIPGIKEALLGKQMDTLQMVFCSMREKMEEFHAVVLSLEKIARDANQLVKGGSALTPQQMKLQIGLWPSLDYCLEGLRTIYEMHQSEYTLKLSLVTSLTLKSTSAEIAAMNQLLVDQPNIPKDQVQAIFDRIFAEEIC
ncbi:hypothetical protein ZIOFF_024143 [Zingiber officinale]|uniref:Uncharacterized protein n=1 Tax=Zingiber officinale TaxID=94328 RepID=A0A8J5GZX4_ZINOF|nr:hypothetical protein ZIOFF_024143 [Zingiber officinale]